MDAEIIQLKISLDGDNWGPYSVKSRADALGTSELWTQTLGHKCLRLWGILSYLGGQFLPSLFALDQQWAHFKAGLMEGAPRCLFDLYALNYTKPERTSTSMGVRSNLSLNPQQNRWVWNHPTFNATFTSNNFIRKPPVTVIQPWLPTSRSSVRVSLTSDDPPGELGPRSWFWKMIRPKKRSQKTNWKDPPFKQWVNPRTKSPFSIAMLNYQRVSFVVGLMSLLFEIL
jgi:hypothetical protein